MGGSLITVNIISSKFYNLNEIVHSFFGGLNPFFYTNPIKASITISSILKRLVQSQEDTDGLVSVDEAFSYNIMTQAIENLVILLKLQYH